MGQHVQKDECHSISPKHQSRLHQFGKKILHGISIGYALHAGGLRQRSSEAPAITTGYAVCCAKNLERETFVVIYSGTNFSELIETVMEKSLSWFCFFWNYRSRFFSFFFFGGGVGGGREDRTKESNTCASFCANP